MSFDFKVLGEKLREARTSLTIEVAEAAHEIGVDEGKYRLIEQGGTGVTGDQLVILARLFRRDFRFFVTGRYPSAESQVKQLFRRYSQLSKSDRIAIQEFVRLCEYEAFLYDQLGETFSDVPDYSSSLPVTSDRRQGEYVAVCERNRLHLDDQPIDDVFKLVRSQGIHVFRRRLADSKVSGLYIRHPAAGHCILINYHEDLFRQNFSLAHEYCHALVDANDEQLLTYETEQSLPAEKRAHRFAGGFLVPKGYVQTHFTRPQTYEGWVDITRQMSQVCKVNGIVSVIRLTEINWLDSRSRTKEKLLQDRDIVTPQKGKADSEIPPDLSPGTRQRVLRLLESGLSFHFLNLCRQAYENRKVTFAKVIEMLGLPYDEAEEILASLHFLVEVE